MSDSQWPLYEVFHQERPERPHRSIGAVHAPDAEMALLNARDLFARRPQCHSLWVAPASAIFRKTAEELSADTSWSDEIIPLDTPAETYYVFQKSSQRRGMAFVSHVGQVEARSPAEAMREAIAHYDEGSPFVWWVFPKRAIHHSDDEDAESWFAPAADKQYRMPNQYRTVFTMRQIKRREGEGQNEDVV